MTKKKPNPLQSVESEIYAIEKRLEKIHNRLNDFDEGDFSEINPYIFKHLEAATICVNAARGCIPIKPLDSFKML